jgi:hypothetical protein
MMHRIRHVISPCLALGNGDSRNGAHSQVPMLQMSNGVEMPALGLGTFQVGLKSTLKNI